MSTTPTSHLDRVIAGRIARRIRSKNPTRRVNHPRRPNRPPGPPPWTDRPPRFY